MKSSLEGNQQQIFFPIYPSILFFFFCRGGKNKLAPKGELCYLRKKDFVNLMEVWPLFTDLSKNRNYNTFSENIPYNYFNSLNICIYVNTTMNLSKGVLCIIPAFSFSKSCCIISLLFKSKQQLELVLLPTPRCRRTEGRSSRNQKWARDIGSELWKWDSAKWRLLLILSHTPLLLRERIRIIPGLYNFFTISWPLWRH